MSVFDELERAFNSFRSAAFRLETLPEYWAEEERDEFRMFLAGEALPERSAATDPWLARVAQTTAAGKQWRRVHIVTRPLNDYLRFEFDGYHGNVESGEEVLVGDADLHPELANLGPDFWLFDADQSSEFALLMDYDQHGRLVGLHYTADAATLAGLRHQRDIAVGCSIPFQRFMTTTEV